jgi:hypothetical protein
MFTFDPNTGAMTAVGGTAGGSPQVGGFTLPSGATTRMLAATPRPGPSGPNWSSVRWTQWGRLAGWAALAGLALAGLVLQWRCRGRRATPRLAGVLLIMAWASFGGYFAWHGARFVMELL